MGQNLMSVRIQPILPEAANHLIKALDDYQAALYPAESNHLDSIETLTRSNALMLGAVENNNVIAMGAVKVFDDYGEIKRLYVPEQHRGRGLAKRIMAVLEIHLITLEILWAKLETGIYQPEAVGLYKKLGYETCGPFGAYQPDPLSVFMSKHLLPAEE